MRAKITVLPATRTGATVRYHRRVKYSFASRNAASKRQRRKTE